MFKNVVPENKYTRITQSMNSGEEVHYALILANVHKKGLQKVEPSLLDTACRFVMLLPSE